jgi:hypothetical protein
MMENISPLSQWGQQNGDLVLFKPQDALRGLDRFLAVDYMLKQPAQTVTVELLDAQSKVIRSFTGTAADAAAPAAPAAFSRGVAANPKPAVGAGLHRLIWDLRYPPAASFPGLIMWSASTAGPTAPPGTYQVRVTADRQSQTQSFAVKREPTLLAKVTDADLQKQFDLAMKINGKVSAAHDGVLLVRGIRPQIKDRQGKLDSKTGPTAKALEDLEKNLTAVEVQLYQTKNQSGQDPLNYPIMLNNKIAALQGVVESADVAPTEQSGEMYEMLAGRVGEQLVKLDSTVKTQLPAVNGLLQRQKLEPIKAEPLKLEEPKKPGADK